MNRNPPQTSFHYYVCTDPDEAQLVTEKLKMLTDPDAPLGLRSANSEYIQLSHKALFEDIYSNKTFWI